jgi:glycosyltransferase involved in cell wall biosynthesis
MSKPDNDATAPLVSIIVPAYNVQAFLARCLQSIRSQTYKNIEIVAVNDGSSDATSKVLDAAGATDSRIKAIHLRENVGVHRARSIGFEASAGEYIGFVDADDWISPDMFEAMVGHAINNNADIAICGANMVDSNGVLSAAKVTFAQSQTFTSDILSRFCHLSFGTGTLWNKLYKRKVIESFIKLELGREADSVEDYIVNVGCFANASRVTTVNKSLYYYVIHSKSASEKGDEASHFVRIARAYALCLETYQSSSRQHLRLIDILYSRQLRFDCYHVSDPEALRSFRQHLRETFNRIMAVRPESICTLIQYRQPVAGSEFRRWLRATRSLIGTTLRICFRRKVRLEN